MKEFIWNLRCYRSAVKHKQDHEMCWYKYLLEHQISQFKQRLKFWKKPSSDLPF